ncbi:MAG: TonB-dependent receptor plug domain-containing protein [Bacteroidales bacterium]|nr:TonB-dependent receptor plug domain-containing protein [Bacteroidales bacterium]
MKINRLCVFGFLMLSVASIAKGQFFIADTLPVLFARQLQVFPQEKIHLHVDKPYYVAGEKIHFRAHVVDAVSHVPVAVSRYLYVELIDPLDTVTVRLKVRPEEGAYYGHIPVPEDVPEGDYEMRAYTNFMRGVGEEYFFTKNVKILHPQSRYIRTDVRFEFESDRKISVEFRLTHTQPPAPIVPESVKVSLNGGKQSTLKPDDSGVFGNTFNLPPDARHRVLLLETVQEKYLLRQYVTIPAPDTDLDVGFYPEGGSLLQGKAVRVAFKALRSNGVAADVTGAVYDNTGAEVTGFKTDYLGMGSFVLRCEAGKSYHAMVKTGEGKQKRFEMPAVQPAGYALSSTWVKKRLSVSVIRTENTPPQDTLFLVGHTRGVVYFISQWENEQPYIFLQKDIFPSGVLHLILLDARMNPLSERLVFLDNEDHAVAEYRSDRENYAARSPVKNTVKLTDREGNPLTGNFSVAVTDDKDIQNDTTSSILTTLLLTSDLRGSIENPAYYFRQNTKAVWALDLLMMTQGWRRYDIQGVLKGKFSRPTTFLEIGPEISGTVKNVLGGRPQEGINVTALSLKGDYFETTVTDKDGKFYFHNCELPDSTRIIVQALPDKAIKRLELIMNIDRYPPRTLPPPVAEKTDRNRLAAYIDKAEQKYTYENGVRTVFLKEVTITAERKPVRKSEYYSQADNSITEDELDRFTPTSMYNLLMRLPGVMVSGNTVSIRGQGEPLLVVDGVTMDISDIEFINVMDVAQVDVLKNASSTAVFGSRGGNGVIVVFTKEGKVSFRPKPFHIKTLMPLGFQTPVAFYAPKYDTQKAKEATVPDLRTTIHWQPVVQTDTTGVASFEFYSADPETTYSVVVEGVAANGKIIRQEGKISRK